MKRLLILMLPMLILLLPVDTASQGANRAGIVIKFGDGSVRTQCVSFASESISGLQLLQRSGVDVIAQPAGNNAAVCKIGPDGCDFPADPCFCKFGAGQQGTYWAYWRLNNGAWRYVQQGAGINRVSNGDVDGWAWGAGSVQSGSQPPVITFDQICPAAVPTVAPTTKPTAKPTIKPTPKPTIKPTAKPTIKPTTAIVASAPTATSIPPNATPLPATATISPTATSAPTATATPSASATTLPTSEPIETIVAASTKAFPPPTSTSNTNVGSYVVFGLMLAGLLGAIGLAQWRRQR